MEEDIKMRKIKMELSIGYPTAIVEDEFYVDDDATEEEILETANDIADNYIEISYEEIEE